MGPSTNLPDIHEMTDAASARSPLGELLDIARLATPIALAQFGLMALGLVDVAVLGHGTAAELGGASIGRSIGFVASALGLGAAFGLEPLVAQAVGAKEHDNAWRAFLASLVACVIVWIPCAAAAVAATYALERVGIAHPLAVSARDFLWPHLPAMLLFSVFSAAKAYLQAHETTLPSLVAAVVANVVNLVVCNVLVRGDEALTALGLAPWGLPRLGPTGAGIASSVATFVLAAWVVVAAWRHRPTEARGPRDVTAARRDGLPVARILVLGAPVGLQLLAEIGVFSLVAVLAGKLGEVPVAAHHIAIGLASFTFMGALGISGATAVRVGHAIGEGRSPRLPGFAGIGLGAIFMSVCGLVFLTLPGPLVRLFTTDDEVAKLGARLLLIAAAFQLFDGIQGVAAGALRGAGDVRFAFVANVGAHWVIGLPLALVLGFTAGFGAPGLWIGLLAGLSLVAALLAWRFAKVSRGPVRRV